MERYFLKIRFSDEICENFRSVSVFVSQEKCIGDMLKSFLVKFKNFAPQDCEIVDFLIMYKDTFLSIGERIESLGLPTGSTLVIKKNPRKRVELKRGGFSTIGMQFHPFNGLEGVKELESETCFSSKANLWRRMKSGMNFVVICENGFCPWKDKKQIISRRFGTFNVADEYCSTRCQQCEEKILEKNFFATGFAKCQFKFSTASQEIDSLSSKNWISVPEKPCWLKDDVTNSTNYKQAIFFVKEMGK